MTLYMAFTWDLIKEKKSLFYIQLTLHKMFLYQYSRMHLDVVTIQFLMDVIWYTRQNSWEDSRRNYLGQFLSDIILESFSKLPK